MGRHPIVRRTPAGSRTTILRSPAGERLAAKWPCPPEAVIAVAANLRCNKRLEAYSITSSARASSIGGISRPSDLAVLRLITNSYLVDCITGRSAGLVPFRILPA
jgi:hypothetical protein